MNPALLGCAFFRGFFSCINSEGPRSLPANKEIVAFGGSLCNKHGKNHNNGHHGCPSHNF